MDIKTLRLDMMKSKKDNPERSKVLQSILNLAQLTAKEDGNREVESKDIVSAVKKEMKMTQQSKDAGAPFNPMTFVVCEEFLPKTIGEVEMKDQIKTLIESLDEKSIKSMGKIMNQLKTKYGDAIDSAVASKIVKEMLQ